MLAEFLNPASYSFNLYAVPTFLTALAILILGLIVLIGERHSPVNGLFFLMTAVAALWLLSYSVMYCSMVERVASVWAVIGQLGVTLIPPSVYHFTLSALQVLQKKRGRLLLVWLIAAAFYLTVLSGDWFLNGVYRYPWGYYAKYDWLGIPFLAFFFLLMALSLGLYWRKCHHAASRDSRLRSKALLVAFSVAYLGSVDYLPAFGVAVYPFGYLPVLGFVVLTARAIWRHRLVDITPAFAADRIINAMADALLVLDQDGFVRVANRAACQLFDRTEEKLLGTEIRALTPLMAISDVELHRLILSGSLRDFESAPPTALRGVVTLSTSSFMMQGERESPVAFVCIIKDITRRKQAQDEIQQLYDQTRKQAMELERANQVKDEFLSVMSHELRTPLNVIAGYAKIVQEGALGEINPEQVRALEKVSRHSNELLVMVNSIMDATKIEAGAIIVEPDDFPLSEFLDDLKVLYDYPLGKDITLGWDYPSDLPVIRTDRDKLKHILQNLINNAVKFTETGLVTLSARFVVETEVVEFAVSDTGIGIATSDLPLIFDRFRQLDGSKTRAHSGVGLGLHIVKTFVQLLGGQVTVKSELGKGSKFTITLSRGNVSATKQVQV